MKGYHFVPDATRVRELYEASQRATCMRCCHSWVRKIMTTELLVSSSVFFDACDNCWDAENQQFRHESEEEARVAEAARRDTEVK